MFDPQKNRHKLRLLSMRSFKVIHQGVVILNLWMLLITGNKKAANGSFRRGLCLSRFTQIMLPKCHDQSGAAPFLQGAIRVIANLPSAIVRSSALVSRKCDGNNHSAGKVVAFSSIQEIAMTLKSFPACLAITLAYEGGLSMDRADPGNWTGGAVSKGTLKGTKYGVSAAAFPNLDIRNLMLTDVEPIYKAKYWDVVGGDDLPAGFDLAVWDYGVNSGPVRALRDAQAVTGAPVDGKLGPTTIAKAAKAGVKEIQALCRRRLGYMQSLKIWKTYKNGWSARVAKVEAKAVSMFLASSGASTADARKALLAESQAAGDKAVKNTTQALTTGTGGTTVAAAGFTSWPAFLIGMAAVAVVVVLIFAAYRKNKARADAYREAAAQVEDISPVADRGPASSASK
ncbi:lysozyme family protein [Rhizobium ruizarguesonis]